DAPTPVCSIIGQRVDRAVIDQQPAILTPGCQIGIATRQPRVLSPGPQENLPLVRDSNGRRPRLWRTIDRPMHTHAILAIEILKPTIERCDQEIAFQVGGGNDSWAWDPARAARLSRPGNHVQRKKAHIKL